ncbi:MAG TPA: alpha-amylase family glycosyl hydrolase, partial [Candidatus Eisenbacteria bacterium]|nr:alpha-amylase family glycosyl hydrolase [Candidatus Eisenbacteria bacterium]
MPQAIADDLELLYGATAAGPVESRLRQLIRQHQRRSERSLPLHGRPGQRQLPLTQRDVLLITYGDQVREPGVAPLRTLGEFLAEHAAGAVSGVHLLPFYPSSSDDGFSVVDYRAVDPSLGDWDDVCRLGGRFDLMFDAVFNHVSAQSEWFQSFLGGDPRRRGWFITVDGDPDLSQVVRPRTLPLLTPFQTAAGEKNVWTTFSADQVDLNLHDPDVLLALVDVLLFYVERG